MLARGIIEENTLMSKNGCRFSIGSRLGDWVYRQISKSIYRPVKHEFVLWLLDEYFGNSFFCMDKVAACVLHGNDFVIRMQRGIRYRFTIERVNGDLYSFQSGQYDVSSFAVYRAVVCCVICYTGTAGSQGNVVYGYACTGFFCFSTEA